jgi:hypothetical protein
LYAHFFQMSQNNLHVSTATGFQQLASANTP